METIRVRCAICNEYKEGKQDGEEILSRFEVKRYVIAKRVAGYWICESHKNREPLRVVSGDFVVTQVSDDRGHDLKLTRVVKTNDRGGFSTQYCSYNVFGVRTRGVGSSRVYRVATHGDITERGRLDEIIQKRREEQEKNDAEMKARKEEISNIFSKFLPKELTGVHVNVNNWNDGDFEVSIFLTKKQLESLEA